MYGILVIKWKPSFTGVSVNGEFLLLQNHKQATLLAAVHRLLAIPLSQVAFQEDIRQINW